MQHQALTRALGVALLVFPLQALAAPQVLKAEDYGRKVVAPHKGRPVVVNFWATWCDPCRDEMPALLAATAHQPVDVVLVSLDSLRDIKRVRAFLQSVRAQGPTFIAASGDPEVLINRIDATWDGTLPYTLVYDTQGGIAQRLAGGQGAADFAKAVRSVLKPKS